MNIHILRPNGKRSDHHKVYGSAHIQSPAHALLLKEWYQSQDREWILKRHGYRIWLRFRKRELRLMKKKGKGCLSCKYCGLKNLIPNHKTKGVQKKYFATIDHVIPLSKGGKKYDSENLVVACMPCNTKKGDSLISEL